MLPEEEDRRQRAYRETVCDRDAAERLGMKIVNYRSWKWSRKLPTKRLPKAPLRQTLSISLPGNVARRIRREAKAQSVTVSTYVHAILLEFYTKAAEQVR